MTGTTWDPTLYLTFDDARSRPFFDLVARVRAESPRRVVDLTGVLGLAQSTVSAHLATLRTAGLVVATPEGRATRYALADPELDELLGAAERVVARTEGRRWDTGTGTTTA